MLRGYFELQYTSYSAAVTLCTNNKVNLVDMVNTVKAETCIQKLISPLNNPKYN